jgi:hypothetical protein
MFQQVFSGFFLRDIPNKDRTHAIAVGLGSLITHSKPCHNRNGELPVYSVIDGTVFNKTSSHNC